LNFTFKDNLVILQLFLSLILSSCSKQKKIDSYDYIQGKGTITKLDIEKNKKDLLDQYFNNILRERKKEMDDSEIEIDKYKVKFDIKYFGSKPLEGWELYFSLHGGGGTPDSVNENAWERHKTLYKLKNGILLTPRSPTNTWNMWHQDHVDLFLNRLIQNMIVFHDINPNKIYLMGYSAGGDGVYQLAPRMADRFAAAAMMAGHPNDASPLNLRNIGFTIFMGGKDSAYNRNGVALEWKNRLKILEKNDPEGYNHHVEIYEDKGHWMDGLDTTAIPWLSNYSRNPYPTKVVWKQDDVTRNRFYWLKVENSESYSEITASILDQTISIEKTSVSKFIIQLNDDLINMNKPVIVKYMDKIIFRGIVKRDISILEKSLNEYGDPESFYYGQIPISIDLKNNLE
jgi:predicted esterase